MDNVKMSKSVLKDVASLLVKPSVVTFIFAVFIIGALTGILWSFLFLHLKSLEAHGDLFGYASAVQCVGELPFFFFSGWLISKIGHSHILTISLASFGIRFIAYSQLSNPWWVLPIELLQGLTFGAFYPAMASYASIAAPPGTEVTMQGLVGGSFEGLGMSVGGLLGGMAMQYKGGRYLFFWAGIGALVSCCVHVFVNIFLNLRKEKSVKIHKERNMSPDTEEISTFI